MSTVLTASNLASWINQLNPNQVFNYVNPENKNLIKIESVTLPEGPIFFKRWHCEKGNEKTAKVETISTEMLWRVANSFRENIPINFDRVLGASYNTRSVLEALLAHTPVFYWCKPGRFETKGSVTVTIKGHKHLIWKQNQPHQNGIMQDDLPISNTDRKHCFMQVALYRIGRQLGYRTWIAQNDKGIIHEDKRIVEHDGVIETIGDELVLMAYAEAQKRARFIDCIWF